MFLIKIPERIYFGENVAFSIQLLGGSYYKLGGLLGLGISTKLQEGGGNDLNVSQEAESANTLYLHNKPSPESYHLKATFQ